MSETLFNPNLFSNVNVLVTGAGRGIGAAVARGFSAHGANVFAHLGRQSNAHHWTLTDESNAGMSQVKTFTGDLSTQAGIEQFLSEVSSNTDTLDVLINNAGTMLGRVMTADMSANHFDAVLDVNARSVVMISSGLLPLLDKSKNAAIVNVSSISAVTGGSPGSSMYSAAKGFVSTYTRSLATELAGSGIRVNAVSPGTIDTDFHQRYSSAEKLAKTASATPLRRLGVAEDCVPAVLFLAAHQLSGFITGQIIGVNGGTCYYA